MSKIPQLRRVIFIGLVSACMAGCVPYSLDSPWYGAAGGDRAHRSPVARYFDWRLRGARRVGPEQVFSTADGVWLAFAQGRPLPAVYGVLPDGGEALQQPEARPPYLFVPGMWHHLRFRRAGALADARRVKSDLMPRRRANQEVVGSVAASGDDDRPPGAPALAHRFVAGPDDGNMRRTLTRWAGLAGWTFAPEHWTLDADIPLTARADLGTDFQDAVTALLAATELTDRSAQPCFYSNRVLRVIGSAQQCDPRRATAAAMPQGAMP